jgi:hypothetical protein
VPNSPAPPNQFDTDRGAGHDTPLESFSVVAIRESDRHARHFRRMRPLIMRRDFRTLASRVSKQSFEVRRPGMGVLYAARPALRRGVRAAPKQWS